MRIPDNGQPVVYQFTCKQNGKRYIGVTNDFEARVAAHFRSAAKPKTVFARSLAKHGIDAFQVEVLFCANDYEAALWAERLLIDQHKTMLPYGYNTVEGGRDGRKSDAAKRMASAAARRMWASIPAELRKQRGQAIAEALTGKKANAETKLKMSEARRGKPKTPEWRKAVSIANSRPDVKARRSEAAKQLHQRSDYSAKRAASISKALTGRKKGEDQVRRQRASLIAKVGRKVVCNESSAIFASISEAARWARPDGDVKTVASKIGECCRGKLKSAYGYTWSYTEE